MKHLEANNIICNNQYGFRNRHSCQSQLLVTNDDFALALNNKLQVDIGILDFSKAFDKVHIPDNEHYGCVVVEGCYSSPCEFSSGVPQSSVLGPTLFWYSIMT